MAERRPASGWPRSVSARSPRRHPPRRGTRRAAGHGLDGRRSTRPSSAILLQASAHVERALENARLLEEITRQADAERALLRRLDVLDELTRIGQTVTTAEELAERSARLVGVALEASGTAYGLLTRTGRAIRGQVVDVARPSPTGSPPPRRASAGPSGVGGPARAASWSGSSPGSSATRHSSSPEPPGSPPTPPSRSGSTASWSAGSWPTSTGSPDALHVNHAALDSVARIVGISLANFRHRERFEGSERALPDAVRGVTRRLPPVRRRRHDRRGQRDRRGPLRRSLVGLDVGQFLDVDRGAADRWRAMVERGEPLHSAGTARRADGTRFPRETEASPVRIDDEERYLVVVRDLTERQRLQTELVQAQKMEAIGLLVVGRRPRAEQPARLDRRRSASCIRTDPSLPPDLRDQADLLVQEAHRTPARSSGTSSTSPAAAAGAPPTTDSGQLVDSVLGLQSYSSAQSGIDWVSRSTSRGPAAGPDRPLADPAGPAQPDRQRRPGDPRARPTRHGSGSPPGGRSRSTAGRSSGSRSPTTARASRPSSSIGCSCRSSRRRRPARAPGSACRSRSGSSPATAGRSATSRTPAGGAHVRHRAAGRPAPRRGRAGGAPGGRRRPALGRDPADAARRPAAGANVRRRRRARPTADPAILVLDDEPVDPRVPRPGPVAGRLRAVLARDGRDRPRRSSGRDPPDAILCDHRMAGMSGTRVPRGGRGDRPSSAGGSPS